MNPYIDDFKSLVKLYLLFLRIYQTKYYMRPTLQNIKTFLNDIHLFNYLNKFSCRELNVYDL